MRKKYVKYHNDGSVWARGSLLNGKMDGKWTFFRKDGSKMREAFSPGHSLTPHKIQVDLWHTRPSQPKGPLGFAIGIFC